MTELYIHLTSLTANLKKVHESMLPYGEAYLNSDVPDAVALLAALRATVKGMEE